MRTVRFQAEIATNAGYDSEHNDVQGIGLDELGRLLQTAQQKAEAICGIYVPVILSGPNRTCYPEFCGCPSGGEISYTLYSLADYRQKLAERNFSETQWKRAVIILVNELKIMLRQDDVDIEFIDSKGVESFVLSGDIPLEACLAELESEDGI